MFKSCRTLFLVNIQYYLLSKFFRTALHTWSCYFAFKDNEICFVKKKYFQLLFFHYNSFLLEIKMLKLFTFPKQNPQTCESSCFKIREDYILGIKNLLKFNVCHVFSNNIEFIYFFISIYLIFFSICFLFVCLFTLSSKLTKDFFFICRKIQIQL